MCDIHRMDQLKQYIANRPGRTNGEWAEILGVSRPYLHGLLKGERQPSLATAHRIALATDGDVPITSWPNIAAIVLAAQQVAP